MAWSHSEEQEPLCPLPFPAAGKLHSSPLWTLHLRGAWKPAEQLWAPGSVQTTEPAPSQAPPGGSSWAQREGAYRASGFKVTATIRGALGTLSWGLLPTKWQHRVARASQGGCPEGNSIIACFPGRSAQGQVQPPPSLLQATAVAGAAWGRFIESPASSQGSLGSQAVCKATWTPVRPDSQQWWETGSLPASVLAVFPWCIMLCVIEQN